MLSIPSAMSGLTSYESDTTVGVIRPDIENEGTLTFRIKLQRLHFQSSARSAKKSNDFFGFIRSFRQSP